MLEPRLATSLIALLLLGQGATMRALGQAPTDDAAPLETGTEAPPVYIVEVLIFRYNELNRFEEEFGPSTPQWPKSLTGVSRRPTPDALQPRTWDLENVLRPREPPAFVPPGTGPLPGTVSPSTTAPAAPPPSGQVEGAGRRTQAAAGATRWSRLLERDELELGNALARLDSLGAYTPLLHTGWSQTTLVESEARAFELARLGRLQPAGSIRLHRSRFLHLTLDISLQDDYGYRQSPPSAESRWPLAEFVGPVRYRINAQRRVRGGELHFFDHPAFGVLVMVRPAPADPASDPAATSGPAA